MVRPLTGLTVFRSTTKGAIPGALRYFCIPLPFHVFSGTDHRVMLPEPRERIIRVSGKVTGRTIASPVPSVMVFTIWPQLDCTPL